MNMDHRYVEVQGTISKVKVVEETPFVDESKQVLCYITFKSDDGMLEDTIEWEIEGTKNADIEFQQLQLLNEVFKATSLYDLKGKEAILLFKCMTIKEKQMLYGISNRTEDQYVMPCYLFYCNGVEDKKPLYNKQEVMELGEILIRA